MHGFFARTRNIRLLQSKLQHNRPDTDTITMASSLPPGVKPSNPFADMRVFRNVGASQPPPPEAGDMTQRPNLMPYVQGLRPVDVYKAYGSKTGASSTALRTRLDAAVKGACRMQPEALIRLPDGVDAGGDSRIFASAEAGDLFERLIGHVSIMADRHAADRALIDGFRAGWGTRGDLLIEDVIGRNPLKRDVMLRMIDRYVDSRMRTMLAALKYNKHPTEGEEEWLDAKHRYRFRQLHNIVHGGDLETDVELTRLHTNLIEERHGYDRDFRVLFNRGFETFYTNLSLESAEWLINSTDARKHAHIKFINMYATYADDNRNRRKDATAIHKLSGQPSEKDFERHVPDTAELLRARELFIGYTDYLNRLAAMDRDARRPADRVQPAHWTQLRAHAFVVVAPPDAPERRCLYDIVSAWANWGRSTGSWRKDPWQPIEFITETTKDELRRAM